MTLTTADTAPRKAGTHLTIAGLADAVERAADSYLSSPDPEDIHDIRVASRRLRATLKLASTDDGPQAGLADDLSWLMDAVGSTRDADVLAQVVSERVEKRGDPFRESLAPLLQALRNTANLLKGRAARSLRSARFKKLRRELRSYAESAESTQNGAGPARHAPETVAAEIARRRKALHKKAEIAFATPDPHSLHVTRIAAKKLRYSLEIANIGHGSTFVAKQVKRLQKLQDQLGRAHDLHVAADRVTELTERNAEKWSPETLANAATLGKDLLKLADKQVTKAPSQYEKVQGDKPKAQLAKTLRKLGL